EEYTRLAKQCMEFAVGCIDLCRTSDEVYSLLSGELTELGAEVQNSMITVKNAIQYREKKVRYPSSPPLWLTTFVAHSNCQHQLENHFYDQMFCIRDFEGRQKLEFFLLFIPMLPIMYIIYLFFPNFKVSLFSGVFFFFSDPSSRYPLNYAFHYSAASYSDRR
ncbi:Short transient receptor putative channel 2, partial [Cichlidogyrus casuarinus]